MAEKMPLLFVGHGSPMNAIEDNEWTRRWEREGARWRIHLGVSTMVSGRFSAGCSLWTISLW